VSEPLPDACSCNAANAEYVSDRRRSGCFVCHRGSEAADNEHHCESDEDNSGHVIPLLD
jgi:hypothetical protein